MKKRFLFRIVLLFLFISMAMPNQVYAGDSRHIRVGLKKNAASVSSILLKNSRLAVGYCVNSNYTIEKSFYSSRGFEFTPAAGSYYVLDKEYSFYDSAREAAEILKKSGVDAFPAVVWQKKWKVYIGGGDAEKTRSQYKLIENKFGFTYTFYPANKYRVMVDGGQESWIMDVDANKAYPQFVAQDKNSSGDFVLNLGNRSYRGRMEIGRYGDAGLTAVNVINIEQYLRGVVPCEMSSSWRMEALKVQAVCARGFAVEKSGYRSESDADHPYVLCDTASSQSYQGYAAETARADQAVSATSGQMLYYKDQLISTYYSSTSGGRTEAAEDVWGGAIPYLRSEPDLFEDHPAKPPWRVLLTKDQIRSKLSSTGIYIGAVQDIIPEITTSSGRVYSLRIIGGTNSASLQKQTIRSKFGLPSTKFKIIKSGDIPDKVDVKGRDRGISKKVSESYLLSGNRRVAKASGSLDQYIVLSSSNRTNFPRTPPNNADTFLLAGQGYGHGVGMSQSGANGMAEAGYGYREILSHYFQGTLIQ